MMGSGIAPPKQPRLAVDNQVDDHMEEEGDIDRFNDEIDEFIEDSTSPLEQRLAAASSQQ